MVELFGGDARGLHAFAGHARGKRMFACNACGLHAFAGRARGGAVGGWLVLCYKLALKLINSVHLHVFNAKRICDL